MDNYPIGAANDPNAPYNEPAPQHVKVEVTVNLGLDVFVDVNNSDDIDKAVKEALKKKYPDEELIEYEIWNDDFVED
jgi:hypothetical protein